MQEKEQKRSPSELMVVTKAKELCAYVMDVTQKSPKQFRFSYVSRLQANALGAIEKIIRANDVLIGGKKRVCTKGAVVCVCTKGTADCVKSPPSCHCEGAKRPRQSIAAACVRGLPRAGCAIARNDEISHSLTVVCVFLLRSFTGGARQVSYAIERSPYGRCCK